MTTDPKPTGCPTPCVACMTDESHDPNPPQLNPCRQTDVHDSHQHVVGFTTFLCPGVTETAEERADREETERDHAAGDHQHCGVDCEVQFPTEQLRNFVIAKGYPGTAGMLHELLRRARDERPLSPYYEHPECGFRWHGRDGMDIPMRDGQPVCPRCELRAGRAAIEAELLPVWEAVYEPGNVSDYLIGYTNSEAAAKGAAEAWMRSQKDEVGTLEWVPDERLAIRRYDRWFEILEHHDEGVPTGPGIIVRRRLTDEAQTEPVQLRWGLDDVQYGDDDSTIVMLSGPAGEPYWLELDAERAAALRQALVPPADDEEPDEIVHAYPTVKRWRIELYDPLAEEWTPGVPLPDRQEVVDRLARMNITRGTWSDGEPVIRRIVRETTTYTVEEPGQ